MGLTVEEIVELPILRKAKIKSGKQHIKEKPIEWISVIEVPVENFVRKNEFVLSTGIGCENNPSLLEEFVKDVIRSGASVLAFATGRYIFDIPDSVMEYAENHDFIIIDIPWEIRFGDILHTVLQQINEDKVEEKQKADEVREELINCVLHDKGLPDIAQCLYRHIQMPLAIMDYAGAVRYNEQIDTEVLVSSQSSLDSNVEKKSSSHPVIQEHPLYYYLEEFSVEQQVFFRLFIMNNSKKQGNILIQPKGFQQLSWFVMTVLEHTLTACALYFVKENAIESTEIRLKDNFVLRLAKQDMEMTADLLSKGELLGYDLTLPYICLVGSPSYQQENRSSKDNPPTSSLQSMNYYLQKEIMNASQLLQRKTLTTFDEGEVITYLEAESDASMEIANQFLDIIERRLSEQLPGIELSWGIAAPKDGTQTFSVSFDEARTALDIGKQQYGSGERTFYNHTKINRLLKALSHKKEISDIVKETIQPLLDYDQKRNTDLIHTFMIYNKYKGNVSQAARAMNLHRQSLLHRLRNIESLTQLSLMDSDHLFLLELSVRLWTLKKIE
ncbi:PucR family transcriptional regulator ligand-binding domain-containing protein [Radiobacillus kanasensis]|uniref:PucR family transcriptional regulator n=1 Tax=Radiobacillus kanasensis TaxID=2844358 RepID=UPI001E652797|nr:PucR family transcriptional regulator [Radiobacillus kanasensis]UFT99187.1 PucR family transcriptional regulator ligand-binding domain-containing protein [Radiobacillus kanasensis]